MDKMAAKCRQEFKEDAWDIFEQLDQEYDGYLRF